MYTSMLGGQFDIKSADELVASTRLNIIEKEHKSFGSLIDHRQLFALDDTPKPLKKKPAQTDDSAALSNFLRATSLDHSASSPRKFPDAAHKTSPRLLKHNYANEELIWRTKASIPTYFQKRVYEDPTLQRFKDNLTPDQKKRNRELTIKALHAIADRYRAEMAKVKAEMDIDGVFHPAANAHRVHCMYLMKIYKGISAHNIEDPVLRRLRAESVEKNEADVAEEERKQLLLRIATVGRAEVARETAERRASIEAETSVPKDPPPATVPSTPALVRKASMASLAGGLQRKPSMTNLTLDQMLISSSAGGSLVTTPNSVEALVTKERTSTSAQSTRSIISGRRNVQPKIPMDVSLTSGQFSKRRGSDSSQASIGIAGYSFVGTGDRTGTPLEALREKDRGDDESEDTRIVTNISVAQVSKWNHELQETAAPSTINNAVQGLIPHVDKMMFNRMRQRRLGAVDARSLLPDEANRLENAFVSNPKKQKQRSSLLNNENTMWMLEKLQHDATARPPIDRDGGPNQPAIVPFEVFQKMFDEYSSSALGQKEDGPDRDVTPLEPDGDDTDIDDSDPDAAMNAVQYLAKQDKLFDSFLKMSLRDKPVGRRLRKASAAHLMEPKIRRVSAPLGLCAVLLDPIPLNINAPPEPNNPTQSSTSSSSLYQSPRFDVSRRGSKSTGYMSQTRQVQEADRQQRGRKASGFTNCFQSAEPGSNGIASMPHFAQPELLAEFPALDAVTNGFRERRNNPNLADPSSDSHHSVGGAGGKLENHIAPGSRVLAPRRRQRREEEEDVHTPRDKVKTLKGSDAETQASAMQRKLVQMWDCLQVPASERLDFMRKFSLYPFSMKLGLATDLWSEVAVLVVVRQEIMKLLAALKAGARRMPLMASDLIDSITTAIPAELASRSSIFLPIAGPASAASTKVVRGWTKDKDGSDTEGSRKNKIKNNPLPLSAAMLGNFVDQITQRFGVVAASEAILRCSTMGHSESRQLRGRQKKNSRIIIPTNSFARALANSLLPTEGRKESIVGAPKKALSDDDDDGDLPLQIRSDKEAAACLLQLRKIADQLLLASLRKTLDEVSDVVTFGKMSVQEWMNAAAPEVPLVAVSISNTPFPLSRQCSFLGS